MRNADTVLAVIRERGRRGLPLEDLYRQLYNRDLYLRAYGRLYRNHGAMTPGSTPETVDGMSQRKIDAIIEAVRSERYRWTPVRRVYIEKKCSTKTRPLGLPTWSDKLLQEVMRSLLEAYFEPQFSDHSHGFRPRRGCHTALIAIDQTWLGTTWFVEGDIAGCFDNIDHGVLLSILGEKIRDNRFLRLVSNLLKAGYLEDWRYGATLSGAPQGGVFSPLLANIYLDRLDTFVENELLPRYNRGDRRRSNLRYRTLYDRSRYLHRLGRHEDGKALRREAQRLPSIDPTDPEHRRLRYIRYADDFLLGFAGPRNEAEEIKARLREFLRDTLKLELSDAKTAITHARTGAARFLGYEVVVLQDDHQRHGRARSINGQIGLKVPVDVITAKCRPYLKHGKPVHRAGWLNDSAFSIVAQYQAEYRGIVQYYQLAFNLARFQQLKWVMETSLTKTLAAKLRISVAKVYDRFRARLQRPEGAYKGLEVVVEREGKKPLVAQWGGIPLRWRRTAVLDDDPKPVFNARTELLERLLADECELCCSQEKVEVHHVRRLKDLERKGRAERPAWVLQMAKRQRKTLVVCRACHEDIERGRPRRRARAARGANSHPAPRSA
jgi:group II intron reverse transcriptase/maturase